MKSSYYRRFCFIFFPLFCSLVAVAADRKNIPGSGRDEDYLKKAIAYLDQGSYDSALSNYLKAEILLAKSFDWTALASCRNSIAEVYRILNDNENSALYTAAALTVCKDHLTGDSEELAKAYEIEGKVQDYNVRDFEKAEGIYRKALEIRKNLYGKEHSAIAENIYLIGRTYLNRGKYHEAGNYFDDAVAMKIKLSGENEISLYDPYMSQAVMYRRMTKLDESLRYYQKAQTVWKNNKRPEDHPGYGLLIYGMGNLYIESGMYEDARQNYLQAVKIFEKFFGEKDFRVSTTYSNIGACYSNQLEFVSAFQYYSKALRINEEILPENHPFVTSVYVDFADMYNQFGKFEESARYGRRAIELIEKYQQKEGNPALGYAYMYHASTLADLNRLPEALERISKAIIILGTTDEHHVLSDCYTISGYINNGLKNYAAAEDHYQKAIQAYTDSIRPTRHLGYSLGAYGTFKNGQKQYEKALALFNRGLYHLDIAISENGELKSVNNFLTTDFLTDLLPDRGEALLGLYTTTHDQRYLMMALQNYTFLTSVYEKVIKDSKAERSKLLQTPNLAAYYGKAVECSMKLFEQTHDHKYTEQAFAFAEQSKAIILWQYVHDTQARQFSNIPLSVTAEERRLKEKISFLEKKMAEQNGREIGADTTTRTLQQKHFQLKSGYDSLLNQIAKDYPAYHALKYKRTESNISDLKKGLRENEAILEYLIGENNIYAFLISPDTFEVFTFLNDKTVRGSAEVMRSSLVKKDMERFSENSFAFYRKLFQPLEPSLRKQKITRMTIVPDGFISYIPMDALMREETVKPDYRNYAYLLRDYSFHYQFSVSLIQEYRTLKNTRAGEDFIGFAPSFERTSSAPEERLSSLAFSSEEVSDITNIFHGKSFLGETATESRFKNLGPQFNIIHLATHAILDDQDADLSRLHFATQDSLEDGRLHAYELFNMTIPASLVTLSACNTGMGQLHKGEGVMSLSRAFAYAGCPSIVTSLWQAQDKSTAILMKYFYENLAKGKDKAEALRLAKIKYLDEADKIKSLPFFWAGFILVGDESPIRQNNNRNLIIIGVVAAGLVAFGFTIKRKFYS